MLHTINITITNQAKHRSQLERIQKISPLGTWTQAWPLLGISRGGPLIQLEAKVVLKIGSASCLPKHEEV